MVIIPSLKLTLEYIIEAIYKKYLETDKKHFTVNELHEIILSRLTVMPKTIANYLKQLTALGFFTQFEMNLIITDKLIEKGRELAERKQSYLSLDKDEKQTDETGLFKY